MLQVNATSTIYMATNHVDFRKGIEGLAAICRNKLNFDPLDGAIFLFYNRGKTAIKILAYDGQGLWLCNKRLSKGSFLWRNNINNTKQTLSTKQICYRLLLLLINNGTGEFTDDWRQVKAS